MKYGAESTYVGLRATKLELNQTNLSLFHPCRSSRIGHRDLVKRQTFNKLSVFNRPANLLHYSDISQVDIGRGGGDKSGDSGNRNGGKG